MDYKPIDVIIQFVIIGVIGFIIWKIWDQLNWSHVWFLVAVLLARLVIEYDKGVQNGR